MPAHSVVPAPGRPVRLLDQVREAIRARHYSPRTEKAYVFWARKFIVFHGKRHPATMGEDEVRGFLSHLALRLSVSASTQNQAFAALLFLYRDVLGRELVGLVKRWCAFFSASMAFPGSPRSSCTAPACVCSKR
jgi:hypothetical protein